MPLLGDQLKGTLPRKTTGNDGKESASNRTKAATDTLTADQQRQVERLKQVDADVRAHEQAHIAKGQGVVTSGAQYTYMYGPDGKQYAVAGEVAIDTAPEQKPEDNIDKGQRIQTAALAPVDPSPQDYRVASIGSALEDKGRVDLDALQAEQRAAEAAQAEAQRQANATTYATTNASANTTGTTNTASQAGGPSGDSRRSDTGREEGNRIEVSGAADLSRQNDVTRQRLGQLYALPGIGAQTVSVFA